jgi:hypothetical protein
MDYINQFIIKKRSKRIVISRLTDVDKVERKLFLDFIFLILGISSAAIPFFYNSFNKEIAVISFSLWILISLFIYLINEHHIGDLRGTEYSGEDYTILDLFVAVFLKVLMFFCTPNYKKFISSKVEDKAYLSIVSIKSFYEMYHFDYELLFALGVKPFLNRYFRRQEKTLINFFKERLRNGDRDFQHNFVFYSLIVPKKSIISIDALKSILTNNQFPNNKSFFIEGASMDWILDPYSKIDEIFNLYSENDIKKLFTKYFDYELYLESLEIANKHEIEIPVYKSIEEIHKYLIILDSDIETGCFSLEQEKKEPKLINLKQEFKIGDDVYKFHVFFNMYEIYDWGKTLRNCLEKDTRHYKNDIVNKRRYLVGVYKNGKKYAVLQLNKKGIIMELRKRLNLELDRLEITYIHANVSDFFNSRR